MRHQTIVGFAGAFCIGCTSSPPAPAPPKVTMGGFTIEEEKAYAMGKTQFVADSVYVFEKGAGSKLSRKLIQAGLSFRNGYLINPDGMLTVVEHRSGKPLAPADKFTVGKLAREVKGKILPFGQPPYRFGPDGSTPIVMIPSATYSPAKYAEVVPMEAALSFPDKKAAIQASDYVDSTVYKVGITESNMNVTFKAQMGANTDIAGEFQRLAERFGGKLKSIEYTRNL